MPVFLDGRLRVCLIGRLILQNTKQRIEKKKIGLNIRRKRAVVLFGEAVIIQYRFLSLKSGKTILKETVTMTTGP